MAIIAIDVVQVDAQTMIVGSEPYVNVLGYVGLGVGVTRDIVFGGELSVVGRTSIKATPANIPCQSRVRLLREIDAMPLRETWSDPVTGAFRFDDLAASAKYITLAQDPTGNYQAVAADRLTAEPTP